MYPQVIQPRPIMSHANKATDIHRTTGVGDGTTPKRRRGLHASVGRSLIRLVANLRSQGHIWQKLSTLTPLHAEALRSLTSRLATIASQGQASACRQKLFYVYHLAILLSFELASSISPLSSRCVLNSGSLYESADDRGIVLLALNHHAQPSLQSEPC
jgi:hypothetical protein